MEVAGASDQVSALKKQLDREKASSESQTNLAVACRETQTENAVARRSSGSIIAASATDSNQHLSEVRVITARSNSSEVIRRSASDEHEESKSAGGPKKNRQARQVAPLDM